MNVTLTYDKLDRLNVQRLNGPLAVKWFIQEQLQLQGTTVYALERMSGLDHPRGYHVLKGKSDSWMATVRMLNGLGYDVTICKEGM